MPESNEPNGASALRRPSRRAVPRRLSARAAAGCLLLLVLSSVGCGGDRPEDPEAPTTATLCGSAQGSPTGTWNGYAVTAFAGSATGVVELAEATVDESSFCLEINPPTDESIVYLVARYPEVGHRTLVSVLGKGDLPSEVVINPLTTVAAAYAMNQFIHLDGQPVPSKAGSNGICHCPARRTRPAPAPASPAIASPYQQQLCYCR